MGQTQIVNLNPDNLDDLCRVCLPGEKAHDPIYLTAIALKRRWAQEKLRLWGSFAKLAYEAAELAGFIQLEPLAEAQLVRIHCIYVPQAAHWQKGIGRQLLSGVVEEMKQPQTWFAGQPAQALVTQTFRGEKPGQLSARAFFEKEGFIPAAEGSDLLVYALTEGFVYQPVTDTTAEYVPQEEDLGRALIIYGPCSCPFSYVFWQMAARTIEELAPGIQVRWVDKEQEPAAVLRRGQFEGCVVNTKPIRAFVLDAAEFRSEVQQALATP